SVGARTVVGEHVVEPEALDHEALEVLDGGGAPGRALGRVGGAAEAGRGGGGERRAAIESRGLASRHRGALLEVAALLKVGEERRHRAPATSPLRRSQTERLGVGGGRLAPLL